jgi:UDP-glucose 4-epimerase
MKLIVTGAGGFLGSHTVKYFRNKGHDVTAFTQDVRRNLPYERFDCIFHFAAFVGGRKGIDNNRWLITENIEIDRITFKWAEEWCKKIIYPSSCAAYPTYLQEQPNTPMQEDQFGNGKTFDLYGLSKVAAEAMLKTLTIPAMVMRPFTIYGPGQDLDYPIPAIIQRAKQGECSVWGSGTQTRDWIYIDDALQVFEFLLYKKESITTNLATGKAITFKEIAEIVFTLIHGVEIPVETQSDQPEGASHRVGCTKRMESLGLYCNTSIEDGIRKMVEWSRE